MIDGLHPNLTTPGHNPVTAQRHIRTRRQPERHQARHPHIWPPVGGTMPKPLPLVVLPIVIALAATGCGSTSSATASGQSSPAAAAASAPASPDCRSQAISWKNNGGESQLKAVASDLGAEQTAGNALISAMSSSSGLSSAESALQSAAASLQSDAQAAEANLPPPCIPGLRSDEGQALTDYSKAAANSENAVSELGSGSDGVAVGDMTSATAAEDAGNTKMAAAVTDINTFNNGNEG